MISRTMVFLFAIINTSCTHYSFNVPHNDKAFENTAVISDNISISVFEIRKNETRDIGESIPGQQIRNDFQVIASLLVQAKITHVDVYMNPLNRSEYCGGWCGAVVPRSVTNEMEVEWKGTGPSGEIKHAIRDSEYKQTQWSLYAPVSAAKLIYSSTTGSWDSEYGVGENLFGVAERLKGVVDLNRSMILDYQAGRMYFE